MKPEALGIAPKSTTPRSRLFHLEPIGVGSAFVESLSGYVARLAEQHRVTTYHFFSKEIALHLHKPGRITSYINFESFAKAVNGTCGLSSDMIDVFERLTLRRDLRFTTMVPWRSVFATRALIRGTRAWCPACYEEQADGSPYVYDQLIWSFDAVSVCGKHKIPLDIKCPSCTRRQLHITYGSRPGFCSSCRAWLGSKERIGVARNAGVDVHADTDAAVKTAEWVGALLALTPKLGENMTTSTFVTNLSKHLQERYDGKDILISQSLPVPPTTVNRWVKGKKLPSLGKVLDICLTLDVPLTDIICVPAEQAQTSEGPNKLTKALQSLGRPIRRGDWREHEVLAGIEKVLLAALEEHPPISVTKLLAKLGCNKRTLRRKFPELTKKLGRKSLAYHMPKVDVKRASEVLKHACGEEPPPSLREVSGRLGAGHSVKSLNIKFPEECSLIVERYRSRFKSDIDYDGIEKAMRDSLSENPPPSLANLCRRRGVAVNYVRQKLPELWALARQRYVRYLEEEMTSRRAVLVEEITSNAKKMLRDGVRPNTASLYAMRTVPCGKAHFNQEFRRILHELTSDDIRA